jgi:hypothetical protein
MMSLAKIEQKFALSSSLAARVQTIDLAAQVAASYSDLDSRQQGDEAVAEILALSAHVNWGLCCGL